MMGRGRVQLPRATGATLVALTLLSAPLAPRPALASYTATQAPTADPRAAPTAEPLTETLPLPSPPPAPVEPAVTAPTPPPPRVAAATAPTPTRLTPPVDPDPPSSGLRRGGIAALAGGLSFFGLFYVVSAIAGLALHDSGKKKLHDPDTASRGDAQIHAGNRMLIPLVGPWVAFPYLESGGQEGAAIVGCFQLFGAIATIAGVAMIRSDARSSRAAALRRRVFFTGTATPRLAGAGLTLRF